MPTHIPLVEADSPNMKCPSNGIVILNSTIGQHAHIKGIPVMDTQDTYPVSGCQGHPPGASPDVQQFCTQVVNPHDMKVNVFKVKGKYVADANKVGVLVTDKGQPITLPNPFAKPYIK